MKIVHYPWRAIFFSRLLEFCFFPLAWLIREAQPNILVKKILVVEPFNLGDAVSLSVMLDPLKERFPEAKIHLVLKESGAALYENDSRITKIHIFDFPWAKRDHKYDLRGFKWRSFFHLLHLLHQEHFDVSIDTRGEIRNQLLMTLIGSRRRVGYTNYLCSNVRIKGLLLTDSAGDVPIMSREEINLETIKLLGCNISNRQLHLEQSKTVPSHSKAQYQIAFHTGGGWRHRLWKENKWIELINLILECYNVNIYLLGEKAEYERLEAIQKNITSKIDIKITTVSELVEEIINSNLLICLDSGPMHIASAFNIPTIALFGPGNIGVWHPTGANSIVINHQDRYPCAPCLQKKCVYPDFNCMDAILVEEVFQKVQKVIPISAP